jgi:hypothetical protein
MYVFSFQFSSYNCETRRVVDEFVAACQTRWPKVLIRFEDFRTKMCSLNHDMHSLKKSMYSTQTLCVTILLACAQYHSLVELTLEVVQILLVELRSCCLIHVMLYRLRWSNTQYAKLLLDRYQYHHLCFNDDIRRTACTALAGVGVQTISTSRMLHAISICIVFICLKVII